MELKGSAARNAMAWELVKLYGAEGARARCCGEMLAAVEAEIEASCEATGVVPRKETNHG